MSIDVIRTRPERTTDRPRDTDSYRSGDECATDGDGRFRRQRRLVDVSDVSAATVATYARDAVGTDQVHLERRAGRTFLVVH